MEWIETGCEIRAQIDGGVMTVRFAGTLCVATAVVLRLWLTSRFATWQPSDLVLDFTAARYEVEEADWPRIAADAGSAADVLCMSIAMLVSPQFSEACNHLADLMARYGLLVYVFSDVASVRQWLAT